MDADKITPSKAFEEDRDYELVAIWLGEVYNFFRAMAVEENQKVQMETGLLNRDALIWWTEYITDREIVENEMFWTAFKTLVCSFIDCAPHVGLVGGNF